MGFDVLHVGRNIINALGLVKPIEMVRKDVQSMLVLIEAQVFGMAGIQAFEAKHGRDSLKTALHRSLAQYMGRRKTVLRGLFKNIIEWFFYSLLLLGLLGLAVTKTLRVRKKKPLPAYQAVIYYHYDYLKPRVADLFPNQSRLFLKETCLEANISDLVFFFRCLVQKPSLIFYPHFLVATLKWMMIYAHLRRYHPQVIVDFMDGAFVSSLMTYYLNTHQIQHINHMHGEIFYHPRWAFSAFDESYLFGDYWQTLFESLHCRAKFKVNACEAFQHLHEIRETTPLSQRDKVYILHNQILLAEGDIYQQLLRCMRLLPAGTQLCVRFHPNEKESGEIFLQALRNEPSIQHLDCQKDPYQAQALPTCLREASIIIGRTSTALIEGWTAGCKVIHLDDDPRLKERYQQSNFVLFMNEICSDTEICSFIQASLHLNVKEQQFRTYLYENNHSMQGNVIDAAS